ncbi:MAG: serine hydrolase [Sphingomonadales bacterium]
MTPAPGADRRTAADRLLAHLARWLLLLALFAAPAQAEAPSPALTTRANDLVTLFNATAKAEEMFAPAFLAQVPVAQVQQISSQLVSQFGPARQVTRIDAKNATSGTVFVDFERAAVRLELALEGAPPNRIIGLLVTATDVKGDTLAKVTQEFRELPGEASLAIATLEGNGPPRFSITHQEDRPLAVGSAFKLFLLAELSRSIEAGERKWSDVVPLDRRSIPSGVLQTWPEGSPITLHTLAALMISQSDNTAADTMLHVLGRENVERLLPRLGIAAPDRLRPLLSTREAALLKVGPDSALTNRWIAASEADRRAMLAGPLAGQLPETIDLAKLAAAPTRIDTIEWFASTADLVRVMNWLRLHGDKQALDILAINSGISRALASEYSYVGYKGGSEAGVINMTLLLRGKNGVWNAVSGSWNNRAATVDEARFVQMIGRVASLLK